MNNMENKNLTIMFTDIKGFTRRTSQQSRSATVDLIKQHNELLVPIFEQRGGKIIKTIGDAFLVVFESPTNAVLTGIQLQQKLKQHNGNSAEADRLEVRVAISTGEVSIIDNDIYGEAVNIAARLESVSEANEVYFTEATYLAMNRSEVPTAEIGYRLFKGITDKIKIFKVLHEQHGGQDNKQSTPRCGKPDKAGEMLETEPPSSPKPPAATFENKNAAAHAKNASTVICSTAAANALSAIPVESSARKSEFGFVIIPICMFLFGALGRIFTKSGTGFIFGLGAGFLFRAIEIRRRQGRSGSYAFAAGFFLTLSLGIIFRTPQAGGLLAVAFGLLLMTYFKRF